MSHAGFPEVAPGACFVNVRYDGSEPRPDPVPAGCGYPDATAGARVAAETIRYEAIAEGRYSGELPNDLACDLRPAARAAAARLNARTLAALGSRIAGARYPYAAVATFGFGHPAQTPSALVPWLPGEACPALTKSEMDLFSTNIVRAGRAAAAQQARVAPVIIVSGGAVHSPLTEAFMLTYLLSCRFGVRLDRILVDPCADHTHTNVRNTGRLVVALGGRTAYITTDDGMQSGYLQDWTIFDWIGGSIDQRSLRDFGYLLGSWRQASIGMDAGFWYTPYRFWAEPRDGLGSFTCVEVGR